MTLPIHRSNNTYRFSPGKTGLILILVLCMSISSCKRTNLWENEYLNGNDDTGTIIDDNTETVIDDNAETVVLPEVTMKTVTAGGGAIVLNWIDPADTDIEDIEITCTDVADTVEVLPGVQTYTIHGLTDGTEYTVNIRVTDPLGNMSAGISFSIIPRIAGIVLGHFIYTDYELYVIGKGLTGYTDWSLDDFYYLMADLDLSSYSWTPIGTDTAPFTGTFKGNNHTIRNLTIPSATANYQGLFGYISGGTVKNLILTGVSVTGGAYSNIGGLAGYITNGTIINITLTDISISGTNYLGGLAGYCQNGTVSKVTLSGNSNSISGTSVYSGGLIGYFSNTVSVTCGISNCSSSANVGIDSNSYWCGCLIGCVEINSAGIITIENCHASGNVEGISYIGGLIGHILNNSGTAGTIKMTNCDAAVTVKGTSQYTGGLIGSIYINTNCNGTIDISFCHATGNVTGIFRTGGLIGNCGYQDDANGTYEINSCYATGAVKGNDRTGGLIGFCGVWLEEYPPPSATPSVISTIKNCYASGPVTATDINTGGLIGYVCSSTTGTFLITITECYYATGIVTGTINVGGLVGNIDTSSIDNCYARGSVNGTNFLGGLVGSNNSGSLTNCYATGEVQNTGSYGGLAGEDSGTVPTACFYDISTTLCSGPSGDGLDFGTAATHTQMTTFSTFTDAGWNDVEDIWSEGTLLINDRYPYIMAIPPQ